MDNSDPLIVFDDKNECNHCKRYDKLLNSRVVAKSNSKDELYKIVSEIKKSGKNKEYDCIIGVSGGVDSTYVAYLTKQLKLRPLAIHFDNGWNSELAVKNIELTLKKLDIDLYTYVIDWDIFKKIQLSFLKASVPDGEVPTDHAINALLFKEASKRRIKYILNGMNFSSESMNVLDWSYGHQDWIYIKNIAKKFNKNINLSSYPNFSFIHLFYYTFIKRIKVVSILNYIDFNKNKVMKIIEKELGWKYYGGKHYESVYTRFYQGYYLPEKFGYDKRRGHLSDLIRSGQISRNEALKLIKSNPYSNDVLLLGDIEFVEKKFNLEKDGLKKYLNLPNKTFREYKNSYFLVIFLKKLVNILRKYKMYSK
jgi:N-acetyl sugar amidotransferase